MAIAYISEENKIVVHPPKWPAEEIHDILGGRKDKKEHTYSLAPIALNILKLVEWYGEDIIDPLDNTLREMYEEPWGFKGFEANSELEAAAKEHPSWNLLYPFQQEAVEYLVCNPHKGVILGLSPGLGKTPVTVVAADVINAYKALVAAPLTLAKNWGREIEKWSRYYRSWSRTTAQNKDPISELTVTNFETLFFTILRDEDKNTYNEEDDSWVKDPRKVKAWIEAGPTQKNPKTGKKEFVRKRIVQARPSYAQIDWDLLVVDESILLKNRKAVKTEVIAQLAKFSHNVWLESGSPTAKFRDDLYKSCNIIVPKSFSSYWRFADFFCTIDRGHWGWNITGDRPDHNPQVYLKDVFFVRNQKDVLPDLPDYIFDPIEIDLNTDQRKAFNQMVEDWIVALEAEDEEEVTEGEEDLSAPSRLAQQTRLLQITSNLCNLEKGAGKPMPNSSAKEDLLVDLIRQGEIEFPLLVWTWFKPTTESIDARLEKEFKDLRVTYIHGSLTTDQKDLGIEMYKDGEVDVLILQMGVGKFGHTLTDTKTVFYHDRPFESDAYLQSLRRVKRIGLSHRPRLIVPRAENSADPIVELNLAGKMQSIAQVASHDLVELLRSLGTQEWAMDNYDTGLPEDV